MLVVIISLELLGVLGAIGLKQVIDQIGGKVSRSRMSS